MGLVGSAAISIAGGIKGFQSQILELCTHLCQIRVSAMRVNASKCHNQLHNLEVQEAPGLQLIDNEGECIMEGHGAQSLIASGPPGGLDACVLDGLIQHDLVGPESGVGHAATQHTCDFGAQGVHTLGGVEDDVCQDGRQDLRHGLDHTGGLQGVAWGKGAERVAEMAWGVA